MLAIINIIKLLFYEVKIFKLLKSKYFYKILVQKLRTGYLNPRSFPFHNLKTKIFFNLFNIQNTSNGTIGLKC